MLDAVETQQAAAMGWELREVYDLKTNRMELAVLPLSLENNSAPATYRYVVEMAKRRNAVALRALNLIAQYNLPKEKPCKPNRSSPKTRSSKK